MGYSKSVLARASHILQERRAAAEQQAQRQREAVLKRCPELSTIEREMAATGLSAVRAVGDPQHARKTVQTLAKRNLELQEERRQLLLRHGFSEDCLQPAYTCKKCSDTGFQNGAVCECRARLLRELAFQELAAQSPLKLSDFQSFRLDLYADEPDETGLVPREEMAAILSICKTYAAEFSEHADSLFLYGKTGLGKTHLSLAIAAAAIDKGFGVVYGSAPTLLGKLEKERFGRAPDENTEGLLADCDLLILDDLGAEYTTGYTKAALYELLNTRLLRGKPTILNSNLTFPELEARYSDRVTSRILGNYTVLHFAGGDMRIRLR
ncbi:MAG TPA: ATP-binding protein [Candidatus Fimenecus excrementigallinarum]|uniref:ATP-binding protein n=1 Tax=Candidatus Fimenecus excrementigallinarum TaxID=2840816 RepID=A0A9D1LDY2_9FIRM|nr:ATP-binding protein [Candidatus Fimenecus excrementigallinarum]